MKKLTPEQKELLRQANEYQASRQGKGDDQMWFFHTGVLLGIIAHLSPEDDLGLDRGPKQSFETSPDHN